LPALRCYFKSARASPEWRHTFGVPSNLSAIGLGAYFRRVTTERICAGRLSYTTWKLDIGAPGFERSATQELARYYVGLTQSWTHPDATIAVELPTQDTTRKGDFGELITACLFSHRLGYEVPFQKLEFMRPARTATVHGPDVSALTLGRKSTPEPALVESKVRPVISPKAILDEIKDSAGRKDQEYIVSAWRSAVRIMLLHPASAKHFALSAAELLAQLSATPGTYPEHDQQAVIITERPTLKVAKIEEHWGDQPPVSELHVVAVHQLEKLIEFLYTHASKLSYGDVASAAPHLVNEATHTPGLSAPVISDEAVKALRLSDGETSPVLLVEVSLWLLADWDGMGTARALELVDKATDPRVRELARLLSGAGRTARRALSQQDETLGRFARAVTDACERTVTAEQLSDATKAAAADLNDPGLASAVRYMGAAVRHRLARHPVAMVEAAGAVGPNVHHVVSEMTRFGKQAFWPSQSAAIQGGLLDRGHPSMAIKMPTSAGKTTLVELVCADALDADDEGVAVVLAPTKALVRQLSSDLRKALPNTVAVRSSHGGLDFDIEGPSAEGLLNATGVVVVTPERFDLEWRQRISNADDAAIGGIRVLVVDEAHLITEMGRGPRLEFILGRAVRAGIRLVLLSSQLPMGDDLPGWIGGKAVESDWTPTWLQRFVYYRSADKKLGVLQREGGDPIEVLALTGSKKPKHGECERSRVQETAALAVQHHSEGLVVVYSHQRTRIDGLVAAVDEHFATQPVLTAAKLKPLVEPLEESDPDYARLLRLGIGVHHANVPRRVRSAVEVAARKNLLRCVICSPTLLEGVDFPTKTVIAAYPPQTDRGKPEIGKLRNLAGRAGRGGRFSSATLIVMSEDGTQAAKWLRAFSAELPVTHSALSDALQAMFNWGQDVLSGQEPSDDKRLAVVDATILAAIAEGAIVDGDLRHAIEDVLGRTLWYAGANAVTREQLLQRATYRAACVRRRIALDEWSKAFYRSGLPLNCCLALREALAPHVGSIYNEVIDPEGDHDNVLLWLAVRIAPKMGELGHWQEAPAEELYRALHMWLMGESEEDIESRYAVAWKAVRPTDLETLIPWVLTAVIDFVATETEVPVFRELAHRRVVPVRLRYGVPEADMCELVRDGFDRDDAITVAEEFKSASLDAQMAGLKSYAQRWKREREAALLAADGEPPF
jgi:superfamily II DNA/RNA helicase